MSRFDKKNDRFKVTCIGIQSAGNFSTDSAQRVDHVMIPYESDDNRIMLYGQGIDAGGGGRRKYLADKLNRCVRVNKYDEYVYTTCSFHVLSLALSSLLNLIMGDVGLMKQKSLQCLHTAYNIA